MYLFLQSSPSSAASRSRDEAYHAHAQNRGILSRGGDSGTFISSINMDNKSIYLINLYI